MPKFYSILRVLLRNQAKAAMITSLIVLLFFTYGHVYEGLKSVTTIGPVIAHQALLILVWIGLAGLGISLVLRTHRELDLLNRSLNVMSIALVILPLIDLGAAALRTNHPVSEIEKLAPVQIALAPPAGKSLPDISRFTPLDSRIKKGEDHARDSG